MGSHTMTICRALSLCAHVSPHFEKATFQKTEGGLIATTTTTTESDV